MVETVQKEPLLSDHWGFSLDELEAETAQFFDASGPLARRNRHYLPREGQIDMARAVARALSDRGRLVVEAGTGVGKTYAYLVPALLSGKRLLVSTATKALQDQLYTRDLPAVVSATERPVRTALLKGRSSYLCLHRLEIAGQQTDWAQGAVHTTLRRVERWAQATVTGDLAELPGLDERSPVIPLVTSTRENCLGSDCPQWRACHVNSARREALAADVVVVNHHLFFADLLVRETGMAELLPSVEAVVFDEAHQLKETGVRFFGTTVSSAQLLDFGRDLLAAGLAHAQGWHDWPGHVQAIEQWVQRTRSLLAQGGSGAWRPSQRRWTSETPEGVNGAEWQDTWSRCTQILEQTIEALASVAQVDPELDRLHARAQDILDRLRTIGQCAEDRYARWVEVGPQFRLHLAPLEVAQMFREQVIDTPHGQQMTWVFASATLGTDATLSWFTQPMGLADATITRVPSPFDYATQAALFVPPALPKPSEPGHTRALAELVWPWITRLGGRTLVLTTTLRALQAFASHFSELSLTVDSAPRLLVQGQLSKRELLERFRLASADPADPAGAVLIASASFWEGVDLPGESLQLVVIDKLPFPPPDDPLIEARAKALEKAGGSAFSTLFMPEAAIALKQGVGRLIRSETDEGLLVLGDSRLRSMGYGRALLNALPPMARLDNVQQLQVRLERLVLTRASTTDRLWT